MKRIFSLCLAGSLLLAGCGQPVSSNPQPASAGSAPVSTSQPADHTRHTVGVVECTWTLGMSAVNAARAEAQFAAQDDQVAVICAPATDADHLLETCKSMIEDRAEVLVVSLPQSDCAAAVIELCSKTGVSVIFTGAQPTDEVMASYDKCWYIGMLCEQTGELLGKAVANRFLDGAIPDTNGDELLQYAWFGGDASGNGQLHHDYAIQSCADLGVFSDEIFSDLSACGEEAGLAMSQRLLGVSQTPDESTPAEGETPAETEGDTVYPLPEAVLCSDAATARGAAPLLREAGVFVACIASSKAEAESLAELGIYAPAWFSRSEVTDYAVEFALNILQGRDPTLDTGLYLTESRQTLVSAGGKE